MSLQPLCPQFPLVDPEADWKTARRISGIRMSDQAFYFSGFPDTKYLPFTPIRRIWSEDRTVPVHCGCGRIGMPAILLRIQYEGGFYRNITFERPDDPEKILSRLKTLRPDLILEPESPSGA